MGTEGAWSQSKGGGGEMAKVEEGCVVWGGECEFICQFCGGGEQI